MAGVKSVVNVQRLFALEPFMHKRATYLWRLSVDTAGGEIQ